MTFSVTILRLIDLVFVNDIVEHRRTAELYCCCSIAGLLAGPEPSNEFSEQKLCQAILLQIHIGHFGFYISETIRVLKLSET